MSELNQDKERLDNRRNPLKGVDAPLRDQIVEKLFTLLEEKNIGAKVVSLWNKGVANRTHWLERQRAYLASWDEHLVGNTEGSFQGSSNLHIPMPFIVCKTLHARYLQAIWQDPPFNVKARNEASTDRCQIVADTMRYYLLDGCNYHKGVEKEVDEWVWRWITQGSGLMKWQWEAKYTRFVDVVEIDVPDRPIVAEDGTVQKRTKKSEKEVNVTKKTFEGPVLRPVQIEDLVIVGGKGDPDAAEAVIEQDFLTASQLWTYADRKIFNPERVKETIEHGESAIESAQGSEMKIQRSQNAGHGRVGGDQDLSRYRVMEAYLEVDVDDSGINSSVVVWVDYNSKKLLRATYLHRVSPRGERPYIKADFQTREGQEFGIGMPEILYPLSCEMDAMHNMRIDWGLISVMPFGFYRASSGIDPETIKFEPGSLIPVDNPTEDIYFPNIGNRTVFGMQEEQALQSLVERVTSISDLNLGVMSGGQGATRTATGSRALVNEMSSNLDVYLRRLNRGWKKCLRYQLHMLQKRIPIGLSFRLTGDDGSDYWTFIRSQDDIAGDFDIEVSPNSSSSNPQTMQDNADFALQMVQNPLALQLQIVGPGQFYEAARASMIARGIKDYGKYLMKPANYNRLLSPEEEANRLLRGMEVNITPDMDHQGFIDFYQHIHDTDELNGQFEVHQLGLLAIQAKKHEQMMQAIKTQAAQQANIAQMKQNQSMSSNPAQQAQGHPSAPTAQPGQAPPPQGQ